DIAPGDLAADGSQLRPFFVWFGVQVPMIEEAAAIMELADIFLLIGSSLQVYPAAGLISYLPRNTPNYIIDKVIPPLPFTKNIRPFEMPATTGMQILFEELTTTLTRS